MAFLVHDDLDSKIEKQKLVKQTLAYKRMIRSVICLLFAFFCLLFIYLTLHLSSFSSRVTFIQNSKLESYTDETLGEALNSFFAQPTWQVLNNHTVRFSGQAYWGEEEKATFSILFSIDPAANTFDITEYKINDTVQTYNDFIIMLDTVYQK